MASIPFEYIKTIDSLRKSKDLLSEFTGLDLEILHVDGRDVLFPCSMKNLTGTGCARCQSAECNKISRDVLNDIISSKKVRFFFCPAGLTKMAVPLLLSGEFAGIFFAGDNGVSQIDKRKFEALSKFLFQIGNYITENESVFLQHFKGNSLTYKQEMLNKVIKYIWNNAHKNQLTLRDVARDNGISYCYLSHLFKSELQITFVEYRKNVKMHIAAKLLKDCRLTIDQISQACGFDDSSYFCKSFKKTYGCTAGSFRRRFLSGRGRRGIDALINERTLSRGPIPHFFESLKV